MLQEHMQQPQPQPESSALPPAELSPEEITIETPEHAGPQLEVSAESAEGIEFGVARISKKGVNPEAVAAAAAKLAEKTGAPLDTKMGVVSEDASAVFTKERMAIVCDGQGGAARGDWASGFAVESWPAHLKAAQDTLSSKSEDEREKHWGVMLADNQFLDEDDATRFPDTRGARRTETIAALIAEARAVSAPASVQTEAMAVHTALDTLSEAIRTNAGTVEKGKEPATTLCGFKVMEADDRRFVITFGVGDGENLISYPDPEHPGETITIEGVPSDGLEEVMISRGDRAAEDFADMGDNFNYNARYEANTQFLGQSKETGRIRGHVKIHELPPGVDVTILLASDGRAGGNATEDYKKTLAGDASPEDKAQAMTERSIAGFRKNEAKARPDDIEIIVARIEADTVELDDNELDWSLLVHEVLDKEGVVGGDRERIEEELLAQPVRKALAASAIAQAEQTGKTSPEAVTATLKELISLRVIDLRFTSLTDRTKKDVAQDQPSDMAAE
jgi:serine/threonine protein phosphatase PrpC